MKLKVYIFLLLFTNLSFAQKKEPSENIKGIWVNGKQGILIQNDRLILLEKKSTWQPIRDEDGIYYYLRAPITNEENVYETWVYNWIKRRIIIDKEKNDSITKKYRIIKMELGKNGKLKMSLSNYMTQSQTEPQNYWIHPAWSEDRTVFTFKRLPKDK